MEELPHAVPGIKVRVESQQRRTIRLPKLLRPEAGRSATETPMSPSYLMPISPGRGAGQTHISPVRLSIDAVEQPEVWIPSMRPSIPKKSSPRKLSLHRDFASWNDCPSHFREYQPQFPTQTFTLRQFKGKKHTKDWPRRHTSKRSTSRSPLLATMNVGGREEGARHAKTRSVTSQENPADTLPVAIVKAIRMKTPKLRAPVW